MKNCNKKIILLTIVLFLFLIYSPKVFAGTATVSWTANTESDLAGYKIYYGTSPRTGTDPKNCSLCGYTNTQSVSSGTTSYVFNNLTDGQTYYFSVSSYDTSSNESAFSIQVNKVIPVPDTTPPTISVVVSSSITQTGATITWTTNESADSQVEYGVTTSYGNSTTLNASMTTSHSVMLSSLTANSLYHYRVKSKDATNNLTTSADFTFTTPASSSDTSPPTVPANLTANAISSSKINLSWVASTDNVRVVGYKISRNGTLITSSANASYSDESVLAATLYSYTVSAYDAAGNNSNQSTLVSVTTPAAPSSGGDYVPPPASTPATTPAPSSGGGVTPSPAVTPTTQLPVSSGGTLVVLTKTLYLGSRDPEVSKLQTFLVSKGLLVTTTFGYYGTKTRDAVRLFQCQNNLACSGSETTNGYGVVGVKTRALIAQLSSQTITDRVALIKQLTDLLNSLIKQLAELQAKKATLGQ